MFKLTEKICLDSKLRLETLKDDDMIEIADDEKEEVVVIDSRQNIVAQK